MISPFLFILLGLALVLIYWNHQLGSKLIDTRNQREEFQSYLWREQNTNCQLRQSLSDTEGQLAASKLGFDASQSLNAELKKELAISHEAVRVLGREADEAFDMMQKLQHERDAAREKGARVQQMEKELRILGASLDCVRANEARLLDKLNDCETVYARVKELGEANYNLLMDMSGVRKQLDDSAALSHHYRSRAERLEKELLSCKKLNESLAKSEQAALKEALKMGDANYRRSEDLADALNSIADLRDTQKKNFQEIAELEKEVRDLNHKVESFEFAYQLCCNHRDRLLEDRAELLRKDGAKKKGSK